MCPLHRRFRPLLLLFGLIVACGCGEETATTEVEFPDWLADVEATAAEESDAADASVSTEPSTPSAPALERASLELKIQPGERFPLRKVVEQELKQSSLTGLPQVSRSRLELMLAITVAEVTNGRTLMEVVYDRVSYSHEVAGEVIEYDSARPPAAIPQPVQAYHGMVGDGFGFWIGSDNQISGVVGFRQFLERCLAHVAPEQRHQAMLDIEAGAGEKGIADFVDNTIGLLPYDVDKVLGESWNRTRHISRPIPMQIDTVYTLSAFDERTAEVTIGGTITPSTTLGGAGQNDPHVRIVVNGGRSSGQCVLDRKTGLPRKSQVERLVDMTVQMAGGIEFDQQKRTLTTVESFASQGVAAQQQPDRRFR